MPGRLISPTRVAATNCQALSPGFYQVGYGVTVILLPPGVRVSAASVDPHQADWTAGNSPRRVFHHMSPDTDPSRNPLQVSVRVTSAAAGAGRRGRPCRPMPSRPARCGHKSVDTTMGYKAVYPGKSIEAHRAFIARRRATRPSEDYRTPTEEE